MDFGRLCLSLTARLDDDDEVKSSALTGSQTAGPSSDVWVEKLWMGDILKTGIIRIIAAFKRDRLSICLDARSLSEGAVISQSLFLFTR